MRSCWNLRSSSFLCCLLILSIRSFGQFSPPPKGFDSAGQQYVFPVNPGATNFLSGTMGELRSTHFHAGLDIRTNNMEGVPIRAAMDGYISRIIIGTGGYGKCVMISHPNGQTTLYAHLSALKGRYGDWARQQQYSKKSFEVDLSPAPGELSVSAGDTVAFSGNTGGSNGAHLHFEIRDKNNEALNPLMFGFAEIQDTYAPIAQKIALKTMDADSRINDRFGRFEFYVYRVGNKYVFSKPIIAHGRIGVELLAHDIVDRYNFICGINYIEMFADSQRVFSQTIEKVNFYTTRDILTVMDFKSLKRQGIHFNKLYVEDGNGLNYNSGTQSKGLIEVKDKEVPVSISLKDTYGNKSSVSFTLKPMPQSTETQLLDPLKKVLDYEVQENTMVISSVNCAGDKLKSLSVYTKGEKQELAPAYGNAYQHVYLIDLRKNLPDSVSNCNGVVRFGFKDIIPSGTEYKYYGDFADIKFQQGTLYDTLFLSTSMTSAGGRDVYNISTPTMPLHESVQITLHPPKPIVFNRNSGVYRVNGRESAYLGGQFENGKLKFLTQELGAFTILQDSVPPGIARLALTHGTARFRISDQRSGISSYTATVNGEWLLMNYDYKTGILQSERLDPLKLMKGEFVLIVLDRAGNQKVFTQKIY